VPDLLAQRIYTEALGYEDLNDHQQLRRDPLPATACGKQDSLRFGISLEFGAWDLKLSSRVIPPKTALRYTHTLEFRR